MRELQRGVGSYDRSSRYSVYKRGLLHDGGPESFAKVKFKTIEISASLAKLTTYI